VDLANSNDGVRTFVIAVPGAAVFPAAEMAFFDSLASKGGTGAAYTDPTLGFRAIRSALQAPCP
jgi:hypothetical protein